MTTLPRLVASLGLLAAVYAAAGADGSPAETRPAESSAGQQEEAVPPPGQPASAQADENTADPSWLRQIGEDLVSDLNRLIIGIAAIALTSFYLVARALSQKPVGWWKTLRRKRGEVPAETEVGGGSPPDPILPTLQELNRKLARVSERIELLVQTLSAGSTGPESLRSTTAPYQASRGRHEAEPAPGVVPTRPGRTVENPLKAMRSLVEERWRGSSDLEGLPAVAQDLGLSLFGWASFDDILKSTAPSLVDLRFEPWNPRSRNPVFVGWRHSDADPLLLAPMDPVGFGIGQGLEALSKLFDLQPRPTDRVFQFHSLLRPCAVNPRGPGVYRLARRGEIGIVPAGASVPVVPANGVFESRMFERAAAEPSDTAFSEELLRTAVRDELSRVLGEFQRMFARVEGLLAEIRTTLGRLGSNHAVLRERALLSEPAPVPGPAVPTESPQAVAWIEALNEVDGAAGDLRPAPDSPPRPETEMTTQLQPAPLEPPSIAGPPPASPRPALRDLAWVEEALRDAQGAVPRPGEPGLYLRALVGLRSLLLEAAPPSLPGPRVDFAQVAMDADLFTLQPVRPERSPHGEMQFRRSDDGWVLADSIWQVFLRIAATAEEAPAGRVALAFPWSRLEKGAPQLARNLVDTGGSGRLGDFVRCVAPAILERRGHLGGYAVVQKMIVAPIEVAPRSS